MKVLKKTELENIHFSKLSLPKHNSQLAKSNLQFQFLYRILLIQFFFFFLMSMYLKCRWQKTRNPVQPHSSPFCHITETTSLQHSPFLACWNSGIFFFFLMVLNIICKAKPTLTSCSWVWMSWWAFLNCLFSSRKLYRDSVQKKWHTELNSRQIYNTKLSTKIKTLRQGTQNATQLL